MVVEAVIKGVVEDDGELEVVGVVVVMERVGFEVMFTAPDTLASFLVVFESLTK